MSETLTAQVRDVLVAAAVPGYGSSHYKRRLRIFDKNDGHCWHCKNPLGFDWHADHLLPRAHGGSNRLENMVPSCRECNLEKADLIGWTKNPLGSGSETQA